MSRWREAILIWLLTENKSDETRKAEDAEARESDFSIPDRIRYDIELIDDDDGRTRLHRQILISAKSQRG